MKKIAFWVEGASDRRFFESIIKPKLMRRFDVVKPVEYSIRKREVNKLLKSMSHQGYYYLFTADQDESPCISARRKTLLKKFPAVDPDRIVIVEREIEAWYMAGLPEGGAQALGIRSYSRRCERKEDFLNLIGERSSTEIMIEILKVFDYSLACGSNRSFAYLDSKLHELIPDAPVRSAV